MSGPTNAVVGDQDIPTNLPETTVPEEMLVDEKKLARYSKSAEFKRLREFLEARIQFYQNYLPNGRPIKELTEADVDLAFHWKVANEVIAEFQNVLQAYDNAREVVEQLEPGRS